MRIVIAVVSEFKDKSLQSLSEEFVKRASKFAKIELIQFKKKETLENIKSKYKNYYTFALCEKGEAFNSLSFSSKLESLASHDNSNFLFVISDADGFGKDELAKADKTLSLSPMTFPHELSVLILCEQIYRALSILHNHPYHRE